MAVFDLASLGIDDRDVRRIAGGGDHNDGRRVTCKGNAAGAAGEVLWDPVTQRGVMRFTGLRANDPREAQYQLWIFDAARDERYPVDGGVFDIGPDGEVLVRIDARIPVQKATLFAVTLERPGGVVVSTRERLVLAAPVA